MNRRLGGDSSLNSPLREEGEGEWQDWLVDDSASQETILATQEEGHNRTRALREALATLNERERRIFEARRLAEDPITLEALSGEFGVSRERVRQIEVRAFEKVQEAVKHNLAVIEKPQHEGYRRTRLRPVFPAPVRQAARDMPPHSSQAAKACSITCCPLMPLSKAMTAR